MAGGVFRITSSRFLLRLSHARPDVFAVPTAWPGIKVPGNPEGKRRSNSGKEGRIKAQWPNPPLQLAGAPWKGLFRRA